MISKITQNDLDLHEKWLNHDPDGVRLITVIGKIEVEANLREADLRGADLSSANLSSADLSSANLRGADLSSALNTEYALAITCITPEGTLIGWKKLAQGLIAKLEIPTEAKRSNATGRKCRAEFAKCLAIYNGEDAVSMGHSQYDSNFVYLGGDTVRPDKWDENRWNECSNGIHFFLTRIEAENYS